MFGHFYDRKFKEKIIACREILKIISLKDIPFDFQEIHNSQPELIVIMMNPGSSKPTDKGYKPNVIIRTSDISRNRHIVEAIPDNAQYQIMRFMLLNGWSHGRIINLSDVRDPKSSVFMQTWPNLSDSHSIFSDSREESFNELTGHTQKILLAWSQEESLLPLARMAMKRVSAYDTVGLPRGDALYAYPSPMLQKHKEAWLANIHTMMKS